MKEFRLPRMTLILWEIRFILLELFLVGLFQYFAGGFSWSGHVLKALAVFFVLFQLVYLPLLFRSYRIELRGSGVVVEQGVIIRNTHIMPQSKMIYTQTLMSPIARKCGLCALTLKAARSILFVPELPVNEAVQISALADKRNLP